jgi:hypothetical protein
VESKLFLLKGQKMKHSENQQMSEIESILRAGLEELVFARKKSAVINQLMRIDSEFASNQSPSLGEKIHEYFSHYPFYLELIDAELDEDTNIHLTFFLDVDDHEKDKTQVYAISISEHEFSFELLPE